MRKEVAVILVGLGLVLTCLGVYSRASDNEFIWDDPIVFSQQLPYFDSLANVFFPPSNIPQFADRYYRPVIVVTYMIDEWVAKSLWPASERERAREIVYHTSCVIYHTITTLLVFMLGLALQRWAGFSQTAGVIGSAIGALLFATHPIHVESVAWMAGRSDVVCALLFTAALCLYAWYRARGGLPLFIGSMICALAAMLSKETGTALVFMIPLLEWLAAPVTASSAHSSSNRAQRRRAERDGKSVAPATAGLGLVPRLAIFGAVVGIYFYLRSSGLASMRAGELPLAPDAATRFLGAFGWYIVKAVWPFPQSAFVSVIPQGPVHIGLSLLLPIAALVFYFAWRKRQGGGREIAALALFFFGAAPSLAIALYRISETPLAERYLYIPTIGLCLFVGFLLERVGTRFSAPVARWGVPVAICAAIAIPAGWSARARGEVWQNNMAFWSDTVNKASDQGLPHLHLGITYSEKRYTATTDEERAEWDRKAIAEYQRALETYDDNEGRSKAHNNMGSSYIAMGEYDKAIEHFQQATQIDTRYPNAHYNWGMAILAKVRDVDDSLERSKLILDAITHLRTAIGFNPRYTKAHLQLGNVLITAGKTQALLDEGKQHLQETIRLAPASAEAQQAQKLLQKLGKPQ